MCAKLLMPQYLTRAQRRARQRERDAAQLTKIAELQSQVDERAALHDKLNLVEPSLFVLEGKAPTPSTLVRTRRNLAVHSRLSAELILAATQKQLNLLQRSQSTLHCLLTVWHIAAKSKVILNSSLTKGKEKWADYSSDSSISSDVMPTDNSATIPAPLIDVDELYDNVARRVLSDFQPIVESLQQNFGKLEEFCTSTVSQAIDKTNSVISIFEKLESRITKMELALGNECVANDLESRVEALESKSATLQMGDLGWQLGAIHNRIDGMQDWLAMQGAEPAEDMPLRLFEAAIAEEGDELATESLQQRRC